MDSLTQPETPTAARDASVALTALLDLIQDDEAPELAHLRDEMFWSIRGRRHKLTGTLYCFGDSTGPMLLEFWRQTLGGEVQPTTERYAENWVWHALTTEIGGVPVVLKVPVERPDVEQQLRDRIAELESALDRGAEGGEAR
ncbi:MAG: hypothetical protein HOY79_49940 [Streptomyces sp.]|nr:hypothetical protein [Streptomyces sp.]